MSFGIIVRGGTPKFGKSRQDHYAACNDKASPIAQMLKDKAMYKTIREGNASDRSLKKDAEFIQRQYDSERKQKAKSERYQKLIESKEKYKRRYKCDPI